VIGQMILTYSTGALTGRFGSSLIICDFLLSSQWQPIISPDNRGSTVLDVLENESDSSKVRKKDWLLIWAHYRYLMYIIK
jgi:hypothetical protein